MRGPKSISEIEAEIMMCVASGYDPTKLGAWYCEDHPEYEMGHHGCNGAGVPEVARISMLVLQRRNALQELKEMRVVYEDAVQLLYKRVEELETLNHTKQ